MAKIIGNTTATPNLRSDWNQTDETKVDYIKNKPTILTEEDIMALIPSGSGGIPVVHELPTDAKDGDMYLYIPQNTLTSVSGKRIYFDWEELVKPIDNSEEAYFNFIAPDILNKNITAAEAVITRYSDGYDLWIMTVSSDGKLTKSLTVTISNGVLVSEGSTLEILDENGDLISSTIFNNIDELPLYFDIPEFDARATEGFSGNAYLFHTDCRLMIYQGDLWSEITSLGSEVFTEKQLADLTANTEARHTHENQNTLDGFYCEAAEYVPPEGDLPLIGGGPVKSNRIEYAGQQIRYVNDGDVISSVEKTDTEITIYLADVESPGGVSYVKDPIVIPLGGSVDLTESHPYQYNEGENVTATTDIEQKVIDAYTSMMAEAKGNYNKIPFILQTDNHGSYPENIYNLCAKMVNFAELSRVLTLGDTVYKTYSIAELTDFAEKMKVFPVEKMVTITGNHDASTTNGSWTAIEQAELNQFWRNYDAKMGGKNGYFVSYDDYRRVKYISVGEYDVEKGASYDMGGNLMSTEQAIFILDEMQKNDGYDIIMLGHCPFLNTVADSVTLNKATDGGGDALMHHSDKMSITPVLKNFKARSSGAYTDKSGIVHNYDFSSNTNNVLLSMHGHTHPEGYYYIDDANIVYMFGSYKYGVGHPFYFGYIDRKDRYIKYWRVTDNADNVVIKVGLDGVAVDGVTLDKSVVDVAEGNTINLVASVSPLNASNQKVVWTSSDDNIATVDENGKVTGITEGSATITVTTEEGNFTASCSVTVTARQFVNVTGVTIEPSELRIIKGGSSTLIATVIPENATNKNVTWSSSDNSKATVVDGVVTGVAEGTAIITATTEEGNFTASCSVNIGTATLPAEYQAVEYIGSTSKGSGAIDTGYAPTSTTGMKVSISNVSTVSNDANCLGCRLSGNSRFVFGYIKNDGNVKFTYGYNQSYSTDTLWSLSDNVNLSLNYKNDRKANYNGEAEYDLTSSIEGVEMPSIGLFYQNNPSNSNPIEIYGQIYRIHSFEITEGSDLVRKFIPCYRKSDNVIGMFEIYTQTFFENIGTGTFEKGADITA